MAQHISRRFLALLALLTTLALRSSAYESEPLWVDRPAARLWLPELEIAATRTQLPVPLIAELVGVESGFQPTAKNARSSASGCGQQIDGNPWLAKNKLNKNSCADSILAAALQLRDEMDRNNGSLERALHAYGTTAGTTPARKKILLERFRLAYMRAHTRV